MPVPLSSPLIRQATTCLRQLRPALIARQYRNPTSLARLVSTLAILEQRDGTLLSSSLASISAAQHLSGPIHALLAGSNILPLATSTANSQPHLSKILYAENPAYDKGLADNWAPLLLANIKKEGYTHIIAAHSAFGKNLLPRVAALLDVQPLSDITTIESADTFVRPIYAGNAILTVRTSDTPVIFTVRGTAFPIPASEEGQSETSGKASVEAAVDPQAPCPTEWLSENLAVSDRPELGSATRVVSGGRGLKSKEEFTRLIPPLADALGAAIGASRAAVDSGFADNSLQVGQTGKNVAPQLYLCAGISGAIQHLAGMKDSKVIACINKDGDAPIFQVADVGLVGDLFDKVPELTEKLGKL